MAKELKKLTPHSLQIISGDCQMHPVLQNTLNNDIWYKKEEVDELIKELSTRCNCKIKRQQHLPEVLKFVHAYRDGGTKVYKNKEGKLFYIDGRLHSSTKGELFDGYPSDPGVMQIDKTKYIFTGR